MAEPAKPFACNMPECGMSFTNEDHLHVHTKKHDMVLQLGLEQKAAFVADQTPTPTRFIRNCEEVGLFQDLQNVAANPFDEGFKRAMEAKHGILSLDAGMTPSDDVLHTPQMVFPLLDSGESALYTNNQRNITISRSSSDESGTIKEFETRTVSKLTNEVTTISRIVSTEDLTIKHTDIQKDVETVSYKNNIIKKASIVLRKDAETPVLIYHTDSIIKDTAITANVNKEIIDNNKLEVDKVPIMSQKSIDFVVESLTKELDTNVITNAPITTEPKPPEDPKANNFFKKVFPNILKNHRRVIIKRQPKLLPKKVEIKKEPEDYEVFIKLPNGKQYRMRPVEEEPNPKHTLREALIKKTNLKPPGKKTPIVIKKGPETSPSVVTIPTGTLIPVTLVNQAGTPLTNDDLNNVPITKINSVEEISTLPNFKKIAPKIVTVKPILRTEVASVNGSEPLISTTKAAPKIVSVKSLVPRQISVKVSDPFHISEPNEVNNKRKLVDSVDLTETSDSERGTSNGVEVSANGDTKRSKFELASRSAASKRYRERLRDAMSNIYEENKRLKAANNKLSAEKAILKEIILEHIKKCPNSSDLGQYASKIYVSHI